jgi:hypothetical protein
MTNWKSVQPLGRPGHRIRRRELLFLLAGATTTPRALLAQQKTMPVVGFLFGSSPPPNLGDLGRGPVPLGLRETGYVEGQNVDRTPLGREPL